MITSKPKPVWCVLGLSKVLDDARTVSFDFTSRDTDREFIQTFRPFPGSKTTQDRDNQLFCGQLQGGAGRVRYPDQLRGWLQSR